MSQHFATNSIKEQYERAFDVSSANFHFFFLSFFFAVFLFSSLFLTFVKRDEKKKEKKREDAQAKRILYARLLRICFQEGDLDLELRRAKFYSRGSPFMYLSLSPFSRNESVSRFV